MAQQGRIARGLVVMGLAVAVLAGGVTTAGARTEDPNLTISSKKLAFTFLSTDPEHVVDVEWTNSAGVSSGNLVAEGGPVACGDPSEFWGQAYGAPEGDTPNVIFTNHVATIATRGKAAAKITGATTDCASQPAIPVTTNYLMLNNEPNAVEVSRKISFGAASGVFSGIGVRPYVPRLPDNEFTDVLVPNGASRKTTDTAVATCPFDCLTKVGGAWNGQWLADVDPTTGDAMIIRRDPSMTSRVELTINYDGYSASNLSSFVLLQRTKGWKRAITETEYLCFEDLTSWPQAARAKATLPGGCGPD